MARTGRTRKATGGKRRAHHLEVVRFGRPEPLDVPFDAVLSFPRGLVGMEDLHQLALVEDERIAPCLWLQSIDDPLVAFVAVDPRLIDSDYQALLPEDETSILGLDSPQAAAMWVLVTVHPDPEHSTVNLLAPVVINVQRKVGVQIILHESAYSLRQPIGTPPSPRYPQD